MASFVKNVDSTLEDFREVPYIHHGKNDKKISQSQQYAKNDGIYERQDPSIFRINYQRMTSNKIAH